MGVLNRPLSVKSLLFHHRGNWRSSIPCDWLRDSIQGSSLNSCGVILGFVGDAVQEAHCILDVLFSNPFAHYYKVRPSVMLRINIEKLTKNYLLRFFSGVNWIGQDERVI